MYFRCIGVKDTDTLDKLKDYIDGQKLDVDITTSALYLAHRDEAEYRLTESIEYNEEELLDSEDNVVTPTEQDFWNLADELYNNDYVYDTETIGMITNDFIKEHGWHIKE